MASKPSLTSRLKHRFPKIVGWMRQRGNAACLADQANRPSAIEPGLVDAGGASVPQETCKDLAVTGHLAGSCQVIGQMAPAQGRAGENLPNRIRDRSSRPSVPQTLDHRLDSLCSTVSKRCHRTARAPGHRLE